MHLLTRTPWQRRRPAPVAPLLSRTAKVRLAYWDFYVRHGHNVSLTCRRFGISRTTFYRWQGRWDPHRLETLEDRSSRPRRCRGRSWTPAEVAAVRALREQYPRWGKDKLVHLLRPGMTLSVSTVGRILTHLKARGQLPVPARRISARKRSTPRPYAVRKPKDYPVLAPGDLVQLDTLDVRPVPGVVLKQFTARDIVSRWDVLELGRAATATSARRMLQAMLTRMPFPIRGIQVDGGSEFKGVFEDACQALGVPLFVLPPRSPKLNGCVERANRTHTEEFYECTTAEPTLPALRVALREWEHVYNAVRPHQALGYRTPLDLVSDWQDTQAEKEEV